jgi:hypothetical protein
MCKAYHLNEDGAEEFIKYIKKILESVKEGEYFKATGSLGSKITISLWDFIEILDKYTERRKSPVKLDAEVISVQKEYYLHIWGIKDANVREKRHSSRFPESQKGVWTCKLEDALKKGIPAFGVEKFRENLCLTTYDDLMLGSDNYFFSKPSEGV